MHQHVELLDYVDKAGIAFVCRRSSGLSIFGRKSDLRHPPLDLPQTLRRIDRQNVCRDRKANGIDRRRRARHYQTSIYIKGSNAIRGRCVRNSVTSFCSASQCQQKPLI
jgi:hypothetical protein